MLTKRFLEISSDQEKFACFLHLINRISEETYKKHGMFQVVSTVLDVVDTVFGGDTGE